MGRVLKNVLHYAEYLSNMVGLLAVIIWLVLEFLAGISAPWLVITVCAAVIVQAVALLTKEYLRD